MTYFKSSNTQYFLIYINIHSKKCLITTAEPNICSLSYLYSWGNTQSAEEKMNRASWLVALQMPVNSMSAKKNPRNPESQISKAPTYWVPAVMDNTS